MCLHWPREILPLKEFPDYIDYLPHGCIVRKIKIMGYLPEIEENIIDIAISREEYDRFIDTAITLIIDKFRKIGL